jgi:hypothetical protein
MWVGPSGAEGPTGSRAPSGSSWPTIIAGNSCHGDTPALNADNFQGGGVGVAVTRSSCEDCGFTDEPLSCIDGRCRPP